MRVEVHCFAAARTLLGPVVTIEAATVAELRQQFHLPFTYLVAVNHDYAADDVVLKPGDEVAIIPPVSGGCR